MSIPHETMHATAVTRHKARELHVIFRDLEEYGHITACSQGVKLWVDVYSPRVAQIIDNSQYEIKTIRPGKNNNVAVTLQ
jgi:hypothetical protein